MFPRFDAGSGAEVLGTGMNASPGAATGAAVFDSATAVARAGKGEKVILVRRETNPDDLNGMIAAQGILTSHGGRTSHAAVVARGMGKTCVCGAEALQVDVVHRTITAPDGTVVAEGDMLSIDGGTGEVFLGEVPVAPSPVVEYFEGTADPSAEDASDLLRAVHRIMSHADERRRLLVRANADTGDDAARARRFGAEGIGLCRTEHMFLGERRATVERLVLATTDEEREAALAELLPLQRGDFVEIFDRDGRAGGHDPAARPAAARVPARPHRTRRSRSRWRRTTASTSTRTSWLLGAVRRLHEENPMLGLRGVRLGIAVKRAVRDAGPGDRAGGRRGAPAGARGAPEIMIPLVGSVRELRRWPTRPRRCWPRRPRTRASSSAPRSAR